MSHQDSVFLRTFIVVLSVLVVLAFVFYGVAQHYSNADIKPVETAQSNRNIKRVAVVFTDKTPEKHVAAKVTRSASRAVRAGKSAEEMGAVCFGCHNAGVAGAPKIGDKKMWGERAKKGVDKMLEIVIKGKGVMAPRGGTQLKDDEIKLVIEHMLKKAGL